MISAIVIDDDYDMVEVISEVLEMHGITVVGRGYNGKEAIELYQHFNPDVVLLNINMPAYDGFYAIDEIKLIDPHAFIVALAAYPSQEIQKMLTDKKVVILFKPFEAEKLIKICKFGHDIELKRSIGKTYSTLIMSLGE